MNCFEDLLSVVLADVRALSEEGYLPSDVETSRVTTEAPRDPAHGDVATNAAMVLAKPAGVKPRELAEKLVEKLKDHAAVESADIAGPGFINLRMSKEFWHGYLRDILASGLGYGDSDMGRGLSVNVEYVSANPTGPLHAGHVRGAVFGDALANLLEKAGYQVVREYYVNDAGSQVDVLARSAYLRYREARGEDIGLIPEGFYPGEYLKVVGQAVANGDGDKWMDQKEIAWLPVFKIIAIDMMMDLIQADLAELGVHHDVFTSEAAITGRGAVDEAFTVLEEKGLIYQGVLEPPKGKLPEDWEPREQTLFRATEFGDDVDRPLKKSDGSWTYFASDIAYHLDKYRRGGKVLIDVLGADHGGYTKRMAAAVEAITGGEAEADFKICQLVHMMDDGKPVKLSKRAGNIITLSDILEAVGKDVVRFIMLTRKNDQSLEFDFAKVKEQSKDNPVFYVQYAHARCYSIYRNVAETVPGLALTEEALDNAKVERLDTPEDLSLIRRLASWPKIVAAAAEAHEPHRIAFYLYDLAAEFHGFWTRGRDDAGLRFLIPEDHELTLARLVLVKAVATVIASGLAVMGVTPVEEM